MQTLTARGIVSISLTHDPDSGATYKNVTSFGSATYTKSDGSTSKVYDVAFAIDAGTPPAEEEEGSTPPDIL